MSSCLKRGVSHLLAGIAVLAVLAPAVPAAPADPAKGQDVYRTLKCAMCHKINGSGGKLGPDLSEVGAKRDADWLMRYLMSPKALIPKAKMPPVKATDEDMKALVAYLQTLKTGK